MTAHPKSPPTPLSVPSQGVRATAVREMFSAIAPRYDLLNHLLSLNIDRVWRRAAVRRLDWEARPTGLYLDNCAGTYDLSIELARQPAFGGEVVAADFAHPMLKAGFGKIGEYRVTPVEADALKLPLAGGRFDGAMAAFGIRNLTDIDVGLRELHRVLRPGGRLVVLDFATPKRQPFRWLYLTYFTRILPFIGRMVSKHSFAYRYLPESVLEFDEPQALAARIGSAGFVDVGWRRLTFGVACLWWGRKASR